MTRLWIAALVGLALQDQTPVFRATVEGVSVSVSVRQANVPVTGLTAADFEVFDNGVRQNVAAFSLERLPMDVTLLLDSSRSVAGPRLERLKQAVVQTAALLGPADRLRLIAVQHGLHQVFGFQPAGVRPPVERLYAGGGTALFDGIAAAMMRAAEADRRQLIVVYTDGVDTSSVLDFDAALDVAGFADALVHVIVPTTIGGRRVSPAAMAAAAPLNDLAARTGGQLFFVDGAAPVTDAFTRAIEEFRTSYVLRYLPAGVSRDGWHEIEVRVKGGPYDVRARKGYAASLLPKRE